MQASPVSSTISDVHHPNSYAEIPIIVDKQALIIEDNPLNSEILTILLNEAGIQTHAVLSPRGLAETIARMPQLCIIFLDLEFPNDSGFDILTELRANSSIQNIPIVAYSVHLSMIEDARRAGFSSFIGKPLSSDKFPEQLQRILNGQGVWETA